MNKKKILTNVISSLFQRFVAVVYSFIIPILLIEQYGSEVNGLISSISQFISYIVLLEFGIGPVIKAALYKPLVKNDKVEIEKILGATNTYFRKISYIFLIYVVLLCIIYPLFVNSFNNLYVVLLILIIVISRFFEYFIGMTYKLFLQSDQKNYVIDYTIAFTYIISLIVIYLLIKLNFSIHFVKLITALIYLLRPLVLKVYFSNKYHFKLRKEKQYKLPQQWDGLFHHIASVVQSNTDIVILTIFSNLIDVSIYSVYALITNGIRTIIQALTNSMDAFFGKLMVNDEQEKVNEKFCTYTFVFYTISTILIATTIVLIIPFVSLYTKSITDANYVNEFFGYTIVIAEFVFILRYPYSTIVYAKGHFKQTKNFSIIEPIVNIILSVILVIKFGIVGVAIGTLISMFIRTFGFIIYGTKNILHNNISKELKIIIVSFLECLLILFIHIVIGNRMVVSYLEWFIYAIVVFVIISIVIIFINTLIFKETTKKIINMLKKRRT